MNKNMATLDRGIRGLLVAPAVAIAAALMGAGTIGGVVLFVVAGVLAATAAAGYCPLYALFGINSRDWKMLPHG